MALQDTLDRAFREFKRYTGDGLAGEPANAPLPVGDPSSGVHNPKKSEIRAALTEIVEVVSVPTDAAEAAADRAEAAAVIAEAAASGVSFPVSYAVQTLSPSEQAQARANIGAADGGGTAGGKSTRQRVVDFHFGTTRGVGYISGVDTGGIVPYTLSTPASEGAMTFAYTGTAPGSGQLIVLLGTDGQYYTVVVGSSAGGTCSLLEPLPTDVAAGQKAWSFWDNDFHPNEYGYNAIVDYALRREFGVWKKIYQRAPRIQAPGAVVANTANSFGNPGSATSAYGWTATPSGAGGGALWEFSPPVAGIYRLSFQCSKGTTGTADITLTIKSDTTTIATQTIKTATAGLHEVDFYAPGKVTITLTRTADAFSVSDLAVFSQEEFSLSSIDFGTHMVFGDSWVFDAVGPAARLAARLPNATVSKSGAGGNKASDLIARFDADVTAAGPFDFVWLIVGTNDISAAITAPVFATNIAILINKIQEIGATPILFTPFAGTTTYPDTIDLGRVYRASVAFHEENARKVTRHSVNAYCGAGGDTPVLSLGIQNTKFRVVETYLSAATNFKEAATHPGTSTLVAVPSGFSSTPIDVVPNAAGRFVQLMRTVGGSFEVVVGYIDIEAPLGS
jgi:hypothetical protein